MSDLKCPGCRRVITFRNVLAFDEKSIQMMGIVYAIKCLKCDAIFVSPIRSSAKATKKEMAEIEEMIKRGF
jgi:hypothetical protein